MVQTIEVKLTEQRCERGDAYASKHMTTPPKTPLLSCEGMCLRGEISRRAANLIAHELAPDKTVRICHGGLLEVTGGMRELIERADQTLVLDGCCLACGTRLLKGAMPNVNPTVIITDRLIELEPEIFGVDEMSDADIKAHARAAADHIIKTAIDQTLAPSSPCCQG
jgi:uncharacterized metal-binding protein